MSVNQYVFEKDLQENCTFAWFDPRRDVSDTTYYLHWDSVKCDQSRRNAVCKMSATRGVAIFCPPVTTFDHDTRIVV